MIDNPQTDDRLDDLRTEYANTGMVTSDGAVWLFSQVVVLREQVQRLSAQQPAVPVPPAIRAALEAADDPSRMADEAQQQPEVVPCMRSEAHPPHLHSGLRKGVAVHGKCPGGSNAPAQQPASGPGRVADEEPAETPYTPPAHYVRDDGIQCCVHTVPVGPDSCRECRNLDQPAVPAKTAASDVLAKAVAALQAKAAELSTEAEAEMRRDLEEQAQVWHEAADMVRRVGRKAAPRG